MIGWNYNVCPPVIKMQSESSIKLTDREGNETHIHQLPIDQPNVGLGCRLAPDSGQKHESRFREEQCQKIYSKLKTAALTTDETYQYLLTRIGHPSHPAPAPGPTK